MSWLTDPEEAIKHHGRRLVFWMLMGFMLFGYLGYRVSDGRFVWALVAGASFGFLLVLLEARAMRRPDWVQRQKARQEAFSLPKALARMALPFIVVFAAFVLGAATHSSEVVMATVIVGLILVLALRLTVLR